MKACFLGSLVSVFLPAAAAAGEVYVDASKSYEIGVLQWGTGGLPTRPDVEWRLADGLDYDTLGGTGYRNYGGQTLPTQLTNLNIPGLGEGVLSWGQSALYFDGVNDKLRINDNTVLDVTTGDVSVFAWVMLDRINASTMTIAGKKNSPHSSASPGYAMACQTSSNQLLAQVSDGTNVVNAGGASAALTVGRWHMVGMTWNASAKQLKVWVDGVLKNDGTNNLVGSLTNPATFAVGNEGNATGRPWPGSIDVVYVWTSLLTADEVLALYSATCPTGAVGKEYPTIQSAVRQANNLGATTIVVAPGDYYETVNVTNDSLTVTALDVANRPYLRGGNLLAASGTVGVYTNVRTTVSYLNIIGYYAGQGVLADSVSDKSLFHHLVLDSCLTGVRLVSDADSDSVMNCTIDGRQLGSSYGIRTFTGDSDPRGVVWENNIVVGCGVGLHKTSGATVTADYNNLWNNTVNYSGLEAGGQDLVVNPRFRADVLRVGNPALRGAGTTWGGLAQPVPVGAGQVATLGPDPARRWARETQTMPRWAR